MTAGVSNRQDMLLGLRSGLHCWRGGEEGRLLRFYKKHFCAKKSSSTRAKECTCQRVDVPLLFGTWGVIALNIELVNVAYEIDYLICTDRNGKQICY